MYLCEWLLWKYRLETDEDRKNDKEIAKKNGISETFIYASDNEEAESSSRLSISQSPKAQSPVYIYNNTILEMRAGLLEPKRGFITLISIPPIGIMIMSLWGLIKFTPPLFEALITPQSLDGRVFNVALFFTLFSVMAWPYFKYGLCISRLEMFTSRHLLIRFNRKTQQVYLHRPASCGGVLTLPWRGVASSAACGGGVGAPLMLTWSQQHTGLPYPEAAWVGKVINDPVTARDEWEFIRRFMTDGPEGLPRPSITSHFPWPWQAFTPQFEGMTPFSQCSAIIRLGLIMIWPAFVIFGVCHWFSLLLCWKPRWPKVIRQAGLPGKPVPALSTLADHPLHIQERLLANAHLWAVIPGKRPEKKVRAPRARRKKDCADGQNAEDTGAKTLE